MNEEQNTQNESGEEVNPETPSMENSPEPESKGPAIGIVVIILILVIGAIFIFTNRGDEVAPDPIEDDEDIEAILDQEMDDDLDSIEMDLEMDLDQLEAELEMMEGELE